MEWIDAVVKILPILGVPGAILITMLALEKKEHAKTREELRECYKARSEDLKVTIPALTASSAASGARDRSQEELTGVVREISNVVRDNTAAVRQLSTMGARA